MREIYSLLREGRERWREGDFFKIFQFESRFVSNVFEDRRKFSKLVANFFEDLGRSENIFETLSSCLVFYNRIGLNYIQKIFIFGTFSVSEDFRKKCFFPKTVFADFADCDEHLRSV